METVSMQGSRRPERVARAEAAAWIVRLHGPHRSPELEAGFRVWLEADPEHQRQFERVTETWDAGSSLPVADLPRIDLVRAPSRVPHWALAAMILIACGLGVWSLNHFWLSPSYATGIGEQRLLRLTDGSRVSLNSNTRLQVIYRGDRRLVRLEQGEAYFEVAGDPGRPFSVVAGDHRITALGTSFVVRHESARTAVTLVEGKVAVTGSPTLLTPGQRVTFSGGATARIDAPSVAAVTAWRRGEVTLDQIALADAVAELNRYDETPLVIDDPGIAAMRISGIYHAGDSEAFAQTVAKLYGVHVVHEAGKIHLRP